MSATSSHFPRTPGCMLVVADMKSIISKCAQLWQRLARCSNQNSTRRA